MLSLLHIENIAVIESADISFTSGFNALTGETGAGKSIIIDSIGAILGARTSRELVRTGADRAHASGVFTDLQPAVVDALAAYGIAPDEDGSVILSRDLTVQGKNYAKINGRPVTMSVLREVGAMFVGIHGQHDSGDLLDETTHLGYLDAYAVSEPLLKEYTEKLTVYEQAEKKRRQFHMNEEEKAQRIDMLRYQITELENAQLVSGEDMRLMERRKVLHNSERLSEAVYTANVALYGDDDVQGAVDGIRQAIRALEDVSDASAEIAALAEKLRDVEDDLSDTASDVLRLGDAFEFNEQELDEIETRLDLLERLRKRYGKTVDAMLAHLEKCRVELDEIEFSEEHAKKLEQAAIKAYQDALEAALRLSEHRQTAAKKLCGEILGELRYLDMPKAVFEVSIVQEEGRTPALKASGIDRVVFLISVNVGEPPKSIAKIASGGELSRIMLALKNVMSQGNLVDTMIFDEIDTGLSGRASQKVAEKLYEVSVGRQVLCVTHSVQLASMADSHFFIHKAEKNGRVFTEVSGLDAEARARELARITSGDHITETALKSARELIDHADAFKKQVKK